MTDYTKTTDFTSKDSLPSGDSGKIIRGAEFGTEFDNIETAVNSKSNINNPSFTGNITVTGTVDGRDIAADGTKLDTIETSADVTDTANVTAAGAVMDSELTDITAVKALNQGVATTDSPTFAAVTSTGNVTVGGTVDGRDVAADGTKLDTVETNADVTDTANVTAAGALMDSEVTNLDQVKAFDSSDYATAAQGTTADNALPKTGGAMTGAITTNSTFDGRDVATDGTKLDGIEASADVTDTANVTAAGALMDSELTSIASVKALNQGVATTDSPTFAGVTANGTVEFDGLSGTGAVTVTDILDQDDMSGNSATALATQQSIKAYVDSQVATADTLAEVLANGNTTGGTDFSVSSGDDVKFADDSKALFGAGNDLKIYHSANNQSYIHEAGSGDLNILASNFKVQNGAGTENKIVANTDGAVTLYYDNAAKIATTSTGIDVTGSVVADGLTVDGASAFNSTATFSDGSEARFGASNNMGLFYSSGTSFIRVNSGIFKLRADDMRFTAQNGTTNKLTLASNGDISFYEDTGTTPKLTWSAASESLTFGTNLAITTNEIDVSSGDLTLDVAGNIILDVDGGEVKFDDGGTRFANLYKSSNNFVVSSAISDGDILFKGNDGGSTITALTLDMSDFGGAIFNSHVTVPTDLYVGQSIIHNGNADTSIDFDTNLMKFRTAGTERMRIDSSGNVGIGTSSLTGGNTILNLSRTGSGAGCNMQFANSHNSAFYVGLAGNTTGDAILHSADGTAGMAFGTGNTERMRISSTGLIQIGNAGSASSPTIQSLIDPDTGIFFGGANILGFSTGGSERFRLDASGNFLVGTTDTDTQNNNAGSTADNGFAYNIGSGGYLNVARYGGTVAYFNRTSTDGTIVDFRKDGTTVGSIGTVDGDIYVGTGDTGLFFSDANNEIRPYNTSTQNSVDAAIDLGRSASRFKDLYLSGAVKGGNGSASAPTFSFGNTTTMGMYRGANHQLAFSTNSTEAMRIDGNGNLLVSKSSTSIGTVGVEAKADGQLWATRDGNPVLSLNRKTSDGSIAAFYKDGVTVGSISSVGGADIKVVLSGDADQYITGNSAANYMSFSSANQERMRIDSSGNLLVGCTSGGAKVVTEAVPTGTAYLAKWSATGGSALYLEVGGSAVGTITCTASATAYNTSSDQRLKDNIVDAPSASDDIDAIQVRSFNWKVDGSHQKYGMVAQELNTVAPEAVSTPEDSEEMMGVDYSKLVPMLVKEIQSLRARVAQLETN